MPKEKRTAASAPVTERPLSWFKPSPYNPRKALKPGDQEYESLKKSVSHFGHVQVLVANKNGTLIGGHQTLTVLKDLGYTRARCVVLDLKPKDEKALNVALNKISGEWDPVKLGDLLVELDAGDFDLELTGFDEAELKELVDARGLGAGDEDEVKAPPKNPRSKLGDLYILGEHRLLCGDSTKPEDVARLMDGKHTDMIFMDPPYGVNYETKCREVTGRKDRAVVTGDDQGKAVLEGVVGKAFVCANDALKDGGSYYVCSPQGGELGLMMMMMMKAGIPCRHMIVWAKNQSVFSMGRLDYDYQHEPILYGWKGSHKFYGAGEQKTSLWIIDRPHASKLHPTMKPIELVENAILNSSRKGEIILDLFGGSGTTLIASENQKRACRMMEIDPAYVDVIVDRWQELTGKKAMLEGGNGK